MWKLIGVIVVVLAIFFGIKSCVEKGHNKKEISVSLVTAKGAFEKKDYKTAVENYEKAFNLGWSDGIDLYNCAYSLQEIGDRKGAEEYTAKALSELKVNYPDNPITKELEKKEAADARAAELKPYLGNWYLKDDTSNQLILYSDGRANNIYSYNGALAGHWGKWFFDNSSNSYVLKYNSEGGVVVATLSIGNDGHLHGTVEGNDFEYFKY
jgi:tetratricopeptide (TPR) repeat protein